jgi:hypothetical protein
VRVDRHRLLEGGEHLAGDPRARRRSGAASRDDGEVVASQPRHDVGGPEGPAEPLGDDYQEAVPHAVAEALVDLRKAVQVEEEDAERGSPRRGDLQAAEERLPELPVVGKPVRLSWRVW